MAYSAKVIEVMIASPVEVAAEREAVREVLAEWNDLHARERNLVLLPVGWETHSSPDLGGRPQQIVNDRLLSRSDLVVGLFWTRIGTPTGKAVSGTVEEIYEHHAAGKPVMLYFSEAPLPQAHDAAQFAQVQELKAWALKEGLIGTYSGPAAFKARFASDLQISLRDNPHLKKLVRFEADATPTPVRQARLPQGITQKLTSPILSEDARELLVAAADDEGGLIFISRTHGGTNISAGKKKFGNPTIKRETARWEAAVHEVHRMGLLRDINGKREIFEINHEGYLAVEHMQK